MIETGPTEKVAFDLSLLKEERWPVQREGMEREPCLATHRRHQSTNQYPPKKKEDSHAALSLFKKVIRQSYGFTDESSQALEENKCHKVPFKRRHLPVHWTQPLLTPVLTRELLVKGNKAVDQYYQ